MWSGRSHSTAWMLRSESTQHSWQHTESVKWEVQDWWPAGGGWGLPGPVGAHCAWAVSAGTGIWQRSRGRESVFRLRSPCGGHSGPEALGSSLQHPHPATGSGGLCCVGALVILSAWSPPFLPGRLPSTPHSSLLYSNHREALGSYEGNT